MPTQPIDDAALPLPEREREYSPSSVIGGDYQPFMRDYRRRSDKARAFQPAGWRDCTWGPGGAHTLSLWTPPEREDATQRPPLLVFIHGGYWQELSRLDSLFPAIGCMQQQFAFAALDYSLAPEARVRDIALECRQALRWLNDHANDWGFDPDRIVVAGSSAGAHLAAMCCLRSWPHDADLPPRLPAAAVLVSGIFELEPLIGTSIDRALGLTRDDCASISPLRHDGFSKVPTAVFWGEHETDAFKRQSQALTARLRRLGVSVTTSTEVPGRNHFDAILDLTTPQTALGDATIALMARTGLPPFATEI